MVFLALALTWGGQVQAQGAGAFVENKGQWPEQVLFRAAFDGGFFWIEADRFRIDLRDYGDVSRRHANPGPFDAPAKVAFHTYDVRLENGAAQSAFGKSPVPGLSHFHLAAGTGKHCRSFQRVYMQDVWDHIDIEASVQRGVLKYDFIIAPNADPGDIALVLEGLDEVALEHGRLAMSTTLGTVYEQKPLSYLQPERGGTQTPFKVHYHLQGNRITFEHSTVPPGQWLTIDPELIFSTYSGSMADNFGYTATYDAAGNLYSGSSVFGAGYPTTLGAYQLAWAGGDGSGTLTGTDIALTKYSADGTSLVYSTYLGGSNDELPHSLVCAEDGSLIVLGTTSSPDFPVNTDSYQPDFGGGGSFGPEGVGVDYINGSDLIVTRLSPDGAALDGSTFLGGSSNDGLNTAAGLKFNYADEMRGEVLLNVDGNVIVVSCTDSDDFPVTAIETAPQGNQDGTVSVLNAGLTALVWSTYVGGTGDDAVYSVSLDGAGDLVICGGTTSNDLPVSDNAWENSFSGGLADGFVMRLAGDGSSWNAGTYFGSIAYDQLYFVELDADDAIHVFGQTQASASTLIVNAEYNQPNSGLVVAKFDNGLSTMDWSTVVGTGSGKPNLSPTAFLVDVCGLIYLSGWGGTTNVQSNPETDLTTGLPTTSDAFDAGTDGSDFYLMVLSSDASDLVYGSFFGGGISAEHVDGGTSRFNPEGVIYQSVCAGCGSNDDFPIFPENAWSATNNSPNCNNGVFKFQFDLPPVTALASAPSSVCVDASFAFDNLSTNATSYTWDFGDDTTSDLFEPTHSYSAPGSYSVTLTARNDNCGFEDTYSFVLTVSELNGGVTSATADPVYLDEGDASQLEALPDGLSYEWSPAESLDDAFAHDPVATPPVSTTYYVLISDGACATLDSVRVFVNELVCGDPFIFLPNAFSPNGDQENDVLHVRGGNITDMYLTIYNRWGEMVFESRDIAVGWDGFYEGKLVDPAVFAYYLEVVCADGQAYFEKGNVTVLR